MTLIVKAPTTQKAEFAADSYVDSNWGAKKQVGKITPIADGVVQVHMIDNHKYGMWKPWKDEEPIDKPISFNESAIINKASKLLESLSPESRTSIINELSNDLLGNYKKAASADATAADKKGDYKRGDKRFSGIVKATKKQFANDEKATESRYDSGDYYNARQSREYGAKSSQVDSGAYEFEKEVHRNEPGGEHGRPKNLKGVSKSLPADAFGRTTGKIPAGKTGRIHSMMNDVDEDLDENLHKWFKEKWVRFGPDGKIRGDCARGDDSEGKPKCLPQSKAHSLGKKGRASAASRKRREDPNPERSGKAINVNTKKKTNEAELDEACWKGYHKEGNKKMFGKTYPNCVKNTNEELDMTEGWKEESQELEDWSKEVNMRLYKAHESQRPALARQLSKIEQKNFGSSLNKGLLTQLVHSTLMALQKGQMVHYDPQSVGQMPFGNIVGDDARIIASSGLKKYDVDGYRGLKRAGIVDTIEQFLHLRDLADNQGQAILKYANMPPVAAWMQFIKDIGWSKDDINEEVQAKTDDKLLAYYAQRKAEKEKHHSETCPHCGGEMVSEELMNEKKDACYYKVKSRYKVWPSAYASGALVKCRKKGADSWGNGGKKDESIEEGINDLGYDAQSLIMKLRRDVEERRLQPTPQAVLAAAKELAGDMDFAPQLLVQQVLGKGVAEGAPIVVMPSPARLKKTEPTKVRYQGDIVPPTQPPSTEKRGVKGRPGQRPMPEQGVAEDQLDEKWTKKYKDSINCSNPKGFSQKAHCAGKQKNESAIMKGLKK
jgi:hypothetical protein